MRRSAGGCYEIRGIEVRRIMDGPPESAGLVRWRERQADLWHESAGLANLHRHMTAEEAGLWTAMWKELQEVNAMLIRLAADHRSGS